jgi:hypothetical protein
MSRLDMLDGILHPCACPTAMIGFAPGGRNRVSPQVSEEALVAKKNKGGKNTKQAAARSPKEKRQAKRGKKETKVRGTAGVSRP